MRGGENLSALCRLKKKVYEVFCIWAITAVISFSAYSQSDFDRYSREQKNDFENYKKERQSDFLSYRKKRNAEFADYLAKRWEYFDVVAGRKKPLRPEPPAPIVKKVNEPTFPVRLPDVQIEEIPPVVQPKPVDYPVVLPLPGQPQVEVEFTVCAAPYRLSPYKDSNSSA